ncbi:MAG: prolyl oligopeptidase family serine peptidase [Mucinivorans sp.]
MKQILLLTMTVMLAACGATTKIKIKPYPVARMDSSVVEDYHGTKVADPYRWMEDDNAAETAQWVKAENEISEDYLAQIPCREAIRERLTTLFDYQKISTPFREGDYYFFYKNDGLQNQSVLYYQKGLEAKAEVFLDPNTLSQDGTVALSSVSFSLDGKWLAYAVSSAGSDWVEIRVMEVASRQIQKDVIKWVKFSGASWSKDGFYYSAYDEPKGSKLSAVNEFQKVYYHKLGTDQSADVLVYQDPIHALRYFSAAISDDFKWLFIVASEGTYGQEILYKKADDKGAFKTLYPGFANEYDIVDVVEDYAYVMTNQEAANCKIVKVNLNNTSESSVVIPESQDLMQSATTAGGNLFVGYLKDASSRFYQYAMDGTQIRQIELPGIGTAGGFSGKKEYTEIFYGYSSFNVPPTSYRYDIASGKSEMYTQTKVNFDVTQFEVDQKFFTSKDGTKVPMFIVYKKGLKLDGTNPTYLYAYGGFSIPMTPGFSPTRIALLEQGGVVAIANIRGGNEYGEQWHKGGMLANKQNVFDDFIAAAEYLIAEKYTSKEKLAIAGGSNGGLLVGACMTQRPGLYAVCFPAVGVMDMLRFHKFTIGWGWAVEYGSSDVAEQFKYIYKYSPLHNIKEGSCYPATLITTADHDDRVVPAHSFKFAATMQKYQSCDKPILIRIESNAGHGAGKPTSKIIEEQADQWSFMFYNTNTKYKPIK